MRKPHTSQSRSPLPPAYAYPVCTCGMTTVLRWDGWRCLACGATVPFRDVQGRTYTDLHLEMQALPDQEA